MQHSAAAFSTMAGAGSEADLWNRPMQAAPQPQLHQVTMQQQQQRYQASSVTAGSGGPSWSATPLHPPMRPASRLHSPSPSPSGGQQSLSPGAQSQHSGGSPSPSPDAASSRSHDPSRIAALIQVVQQLGDSGVQTKYLSQLGILFKQLHPALFVKGILKDLVDHAQAAGLLVLSGPAGQQQVELTSSGQAIADAWRQHEPSQQSQSQAQQQWSINVPASASASTTSSFSKLSSGSSASTSSHLQSSSQQHPHTLGLSFLDDDQPDPHYLHPRSGAGGINNTGGSIQNTAGSNASLDNTASSLHSSGPASLNNTGGSFAGDHRRGRDQDINTTSGTFTAHPADTSRGALDLHNIFGQTSDTIFGVTDAEDSDLLNAYDERERFRKRSDVHAHHPSLAAAAAEHTNTSHGTGYGHAAHSPFTTSSSHTTGGHMSSHQTSRLQQPQSLSQHTAPHHYSPAFGNSTNNTTGGGGHHTQTQQQSHINGSNIHAFLSGGNTGGSSYSQQQQQQPHQQQQQQQPQEGEQSALQLLPPLPISLEEKSFRGERLKHLKYMFHFRVHPCLNFLQKGTCPLDSGNQCFDFHALKQRRRIPRIMQFSNGVFWSYNACRCQAIEKEMRCEKGEGCRYAHCFEDSTQILTERGFMFVSDLEKAEAGEQGFPLIATYNRTARQLEYQQAKVQATGSRIYKVDASRGPFDMVEFGSKQDRARWASDAPDADLAAESSHHTSLLVTSRHTMWASRSSSNGDAQFSTVLAGDLLGASQELRMESLVANGHSVDEDSWRSLPCVVALDLRTEDQLHAFLEQYGLWLGGGNTAETEPAWVQYWLDDSTTEPQAASWVLQLGQQHARALLRGVQTACGSYEAGQFVISSAQLRDQLMQLCVHAGYSAVFHPQADAAVPGWRIEYSERTNSKFDTQPSFDSSRDLVQTQHDGSVWCVTVPNGLIIARRAKKSADGTTIVMASRAVIVGNCKEEIAYHPSRFKSQHCSYPLRADGSCSRFGGHCAFSHGGESDLRKPIVLKQGMPHKLIEPSLHLLQEQQQLVAALTGLSLAELNGFSMSGQNNSMLSHGTMAAFNNGTSSNSNSNNNTHYTSTSSHHHTNGGGTNSNNNTGGGGGQQLQLHQVSHPGLLSSWESHNQSPHTTHHASSSHVLGLHSTDSPPLHFGSQGGQQRGGGTSSHGHSSLSLVSQHSQDLGGYGTAPSSPSHAGGVDLASLDPTQYMWPAEELAIEREFYLYEYKTKPCAVQTLACTKGECPAFHFDNKRRRSPRIYHYDHQPCIVVKPPPTHGGAHDTNDASGGWRRPNVCRLGDACEFSHTLLESMYHPSIFKTRLCKNFDEHDRSTWTRCPWKRACAHAHSRLELEYAEACVRDTIHGGSNLSNVNTANAAAASASRGINATTGHSWTAAPPNTGINTTAPAHSMARFYDSHSSGLASTSSSSAAGEQADSIANDSGHQMQFPTHRRAGSLSAHSREFVPSPPLTAQTAPPTSVDSSRILRLQLQGHQQPQHQHQSSGGGGVPSLSLSSSASAAASNNAVVASLRAENALLVERSSRLEKDLYLMQHKLDEKDAAIAQLQWAVEMEQQERQRMKAQMDAFRNEITQRLLMQQQHAQQQQQQQQPLSPLPSSQSLTLSLPSLNVSTPTVLSPHGHVSLLATPTEGSELHNGHAAATGMAENVLMSPTSATTDRSEMSPDAVNASPSPPPAS